MSKTLNRRIIKCIIYYRLLDSDDKQIISPLLVDALGKSKSSLYYKFEHKNFSLPELIAIENVIDNFKKTRLKKVTNERILEQVLGPNPSNG